MASTPIYTDGRYSLYEVATAGEILDFEINVQQLAVQVVRVLFELPGQGPMIIGRYQTRRETPSADYGTPVANYTMWDFNVGEFGGLLFYAEQVGTRVHVSYNLERRDT